MSFQLVSPYRPTGDQPQAISQLVQGLAQGLSAQTLLGVTGSGKTFTIANVIAQVDSPTLVMSHNKTLAAQLYQELQAFFPQNAVEYFVSYYDYYQPEAYIARSNTYIEKDLSINATLERLRLRAVTALMTGRRDVIVVASVSCIYGITNPAEFSQHILRLKVGETWARQAFLLKLVDLFYKRATDEFVRSSFRVQGDTVDVWLAYADFAYRFCFWGDTLEEIHIIDPRTGAQQRAEQQVAIFPANLFVTDKAQLATISGEVRRDLAEQVAFFEREGEVEAAMRLQERTLLDLEMLNELGYCSGIENYSRYFDRRQPGERPYCLLDYFPKDYLLVIDESHVTLPQLRAMWGGDRARKQSLVAHGFRLPAAMDNRPLSFDEFSKCINQVLYVSATPADYELAHSEGAVVEQVIRPTGLLDPEIEVHPSLNQLDHLLEAIQNTVMRGERILVTTLTKRMAEELTQYLGDMGGIKCRYIHSEVKTLDRVEILKDLRAGVFDVLIGVNLLREGLDLPEVALVAILDADKEGFLRNVRSLVQTIGRAARNVSGRVIMYADRITPAMEEAINETQRRRSLQLAYNRTHGITPQSVHTVKASATGHTIESAECKPAVAADCITPYLDRRSLMKLIKHTERQMKQAALQEEFVKAAALREEMVALQAALDQQGKENSGT